MLTTLIIEISMSATLRQSALLQVSETYGLHKRGESLCKTIKYLSQEFLQGFGLA